MSLPKIKKAVEQQKFVILDTETTGLNWAEVVEIAIVDHNGNVLMNQRVKPYDGIPADATAIHGITEDMVKDCPTFDQVVGQIQQLVTGKDVIVYNATYDRHILHCSAEYAGIPKIDWKNIANWICAMESFARIYGDWSNYHQSYKWKSLEVAAAYYNIPVENAHTALGDCLMTLGVVKAMCK